MDWTHACHAVFLLSVLGWTMASAAWLDERSAGHDAHAGTTTSNGQDTARNEGTSTGEAPVPDLEAAEPTPTPSPQEWLDMARAATGREAYESAVASYLRYLEVRPGDLAARLALARVYTWNESYTTALSLYDALRGARPFDRELSLERARVLLWAGRHNEAIVALVALRSDLEAAVPSGTPGGQPPREPSLTGRSRRRKVLLAKVERALADGYAWNGDAGRALPLYRRLWEQHPGDTTLGLAYARLLVARKDFSRGLDVYDSLVAGHVDDDGLRLERARVRLWAGRYDGAIAELLELRERFSSDPDRAPLERDASLAEVTRLLASAYAWSGNLEGYRNLVTEHPGDAAFRLEYARALQRVGRLREAVAQYEAYLRLVPDDLEVMVETARVLLWSGAHAGAAEMCLGLEARLLDDRRSRGLEDSLREEALDETSRMLAHALLWGGDPKAALPVTRGLIERHPGEASLELDLAHELGQIGDFAGARRAVARYRRKGGEPGAAALSEGELFEWQGGTLRARTLYRRALSAPESTEEAGQRLEALEPVLRRTWEARSRWRADVDGFVKETLAVGSRFPAGLFWVTPKVALDRFQGSGGIAHRATTAVQGSFWYSARWTFLAAAGVAYQDGGATGSIAPSARLRARWTPAPGRLFGAEAGIGDADERLFTWPALAARVRRQELSATGDWIGPGTWEAWSRARVTRLFSKTANAGNLFLDASGILERRIAPELERFQARLGLTGGMLHATRQVDTYWTPAWYGTVGIRSRLEAAWPGGFDAALTARAGVAYSTEVSSAFPELAVTITAGQRLGTRFGWRVEAAYGQTVRTLTDYGGRAAAPGIHDYGLGHVMARAWYLY